LSIFALFSGTGSAMFPLFYDPSKKSIAITNDSHMTEKKYELSSDEVPSKTLIDAKA
jgi:hypothetical protein